MDRPRSRVGPASRSMKSDALISTATERRTLTPRCPATDAALMPRGRVYSKSFAPRLVLSLIWVILANLASAPRDALPSGSSDTLSMCEAVSCRARVRVDAAEASKLAISREKRNNPPSHSRVGCFFSASNCSVITDAARRWSDCSRADHASATSRGRRRTAIVHCASRCRWIPTGRSRRGESPGCPGQGPFPGTGRTE